MRRQKPTPLGGLRPPFAPPPPRKQGGGGANNARLYPLTAKKQRKQRPGLVRGVGALAVLVMFMAVWNPPTGSVHSFTKASEYNAAKESGCTNSGAGCHGSETAYKDFNEYHPNAKCTTCHDYQGAGCIPCHSPAEHECALCHDGSMENAADTVRLSDSYPKGHYRQSKHGATGTDMTQPVAISTTDETTSETTTGTASATCEDCHAADLRDAHAGVPTVAGSTYGADIGCGECHNDVRTGAQAAVKAKWKARSCESCHAVGSAAAMHGVESVGAAKATDSAGCAESGEGCHDTVDLHALHPDAPKTCSGSASDGEPGCHDLEAEASKPQAKSCGSEAPGDSCHAAYAPAQLGHKRDKVVHAPTTSIPANDTSFYGTPCGSCHFMAPDGTSLIDEHALPTSGRTQVPEDGCRNCHNDPASAETITNDWRYRDTTSACSVCHGSSGLDAVHTGSVSAKHAVDGASPGCASSGPGCHPSSNISDVGVPTVRGGLHSTCLRCHDRTRSAGNHAYDPSKRTCGKGEDCHSSGYDPALPVHVSASGRIGGTDGKHTAGTAQRVDVLWDSVSGGGTACAVCHDMTLGTEHARPNSSVPTGKSACLTCHNKNLGTATVVKGSWGAKNSAKACSACHDGASAPSAHGKIGSVHLAEEIGDDGEPVAGTCVKSGCHGSADVRAIHKDRGCTPAGCHTATGDIGGHRILSCGGTDPETSCHAGFTSHSHFRLDTGEAVSHSADLAGTVNGVTYGPGENQGCGGCHKLSLVGEHSRELEAGAMDGGGSGVCVVCHAGTGDPAPNAFASTPAVKRAIADRDHRCVACHASGCAADGPEAVASPHKNVSGATILPVGAVWADPFDEWKASFEAVTGSGHNALSSGVVGSSAPTKRFPLESFEISGTPYTWALPLNSGSTTWLRASVLGTEAVSTPETIGHITIKCDDCHTIPADMVGPHGSSVHVGIIPAYSQTEYANPTPGRNQFYSASATDTTGLVVCNKCHNMEYRPATATEPTVTAGGNRMHSTHSRLADEIACIDCHVRIPHAWKRPRLLVRTVETTDGAEGDTYPYIAEHEGEPREGLMGIMLRSYLTPTDLRSRYCVNGGCHVSAAGVLTHSQTNHPMPSDFTTTTPEYWP